MQPTYINKFNKYYEDVVKSQLFHPWDENRTSAIAEAKQMIPPEVETILDVGSGEQDLGFTTQLDLGLGMDYHDLPFEDKSYDMIWARHALEHSPMPYMALKEWKRVADRLLIVVPAPSEYIAEYDGHYSVFPEYSWRALFKKAGMEVQDFKAGQWKHGEIYLPELRFLVKS